MRSLGTLERLNRLLTEESHLVVHGRRRVVLSEFGRECIFLVCFWIVVIISVLNSFMPLPPAGVWPR